MKIDVKKLVCGPIGQKETAAIELYKEQFDDDFLAERIKGELKIIKLEPDILAEFDGFAFVNIACDRCLENYKIRLPIKFKQIYVASKEDVNDGKLPIEKNFHIDILEPIRQEVIINVPIKKLCRINCAGICDSCGINLNQEKCQCKKATKINRAN